jgi:archaellum component FlaC
MNNSISSDLQGRLLSLSSLVHEDKRSAGAKSSAVEEIGSTILKKIYAEDSNLPTSARLYLAQIASSIIDNKWSDIPPPVDMNLDFQKLKAVQTALALALVSTTIDLFELFRFIMEQKGNEAYNLAKIGIMDTSLSLELDRKRFEEQASANHKELVAGAVSGAMQCVQGCFQALSSGWSIHKNRGLAPKTQKSIEADTKTANEKIKLEDAIAEKTALANQLNSAKNNLSNFSAANPNKKKTIARIKENIKTLETDLEKAKTKVSDTSKKYNQLSEESKNLSSKVDRLTNLERFKDQLRSSIIQVVKGAADIGVAHLRYQASETKLEADKFEAAKNTTDRSANAMSESGRKAAEDVKKLLQYFDSILQMIDSSIKKQFS